MIVESHPVFPSKNAYFITDKQEDLLTELSKAGAKVVRGLTNTDYHNEEFVIEDIDGRWLGFGIKQG